MKKILLIFQAKILSDSHHLQTKCPKNRSAQCLVRLLYHLWAYIYHLIMSSIQKLGGKSIMSV